MYAIFSFLSGLVFGIGLLVSELANPVKVLSFLDFAGNWDPSLALVMAGAIVIGIVTNAFARARATTYLGTPILLPTTRDITARLVLGSLVFGIGWGLAGLCPGPALVALGTGHVKAFLFVVAMLAGMGIYEFLEGKRMRKTADARNQPRGHTHGHEHARARHRGHKSH